MGENSHISIEFDNVSRSEVSISLQLATIFFV